MLICDKCGGKDSISHVAIGECSPQERIGIRDTKAFDRGMEAAFEGDLCTSCQMNVWDAIKEATKPKEETPKD